MKICAMSDLHGELPYAKESSEITLICGDIVPLSIQRNISESKLWLKTEFAYWAMNWPSDKIFFIAGNHDFVFDGHMSYNDIMELSINSNNKLWYLQNNSVIYTDKEGKDYTIFGTPYCHIFRKWAFMLPDEELAIKYADIPENVDILLSHDAADINNLGLVPPSIWHPDESLNVGNTVLAEAVKLKKPKYYFCGHIHDGNHKVETIDNTLMANVSLLNDSYQISYEPLYLNI